MYRFPAAPVSRRIRFTTRIFIIGMLLLALFPLVGLLILWGLNINIPSLNLMLGGFAVLEFLVFIGLFYMLSRTVPQEYVLGDGKLRVVRRKPLRDLEWDISDTMQVEEKEAFPLFQMVSIHKNANKGIFCVSGSFWRKDLGGWLRVALSSDEHYLLLCSDKGAWAISPQDMDGFMRAARQELGLGMSP